MDTENWLVGWREIGNYIGKSAKTAQRYAKQQGMPFLRDGGDRPIAKPSQIDRWIFGFNQRFYDDKTWTDKGIGTALKYENEEETEQKDFKKKFIAAQRPPRGRF